MGPALTQGWAPKATAPRMLTTGVLPARQAQPCRHTSPPLTLAQGHVGPPGSPKSVLFENSAGGQHITSQG